MGIENLHEVSAHARTVLGRVGGEGGVLDQIARGQWDDQLSGLSQAQIEGLTDEIAAAAERVRRTRALAGDLNLGSEHAQVGNDGDPMSGMTVRLPVNRKERFYTGTVLPAIVTADGFVRLPRLAALCGLDLDGGGQPFNPDRVQFLTEYGFAESVFTEEDGSQWPGEHPADTPDIVVLGEDWLLAIEAKVFHNPSPAGLNLQMQRQRVLVEAWAEHFRFRAHRVAHVLLLPDGLARVVADGVSCHRVVTWESVLEAYEFSGPEYWVGVLRDAVRRHGDLKSVGKSGIATGFMTGAEIIEAHADGTLDIFTVGRQGGLNGQGFAQDLKSGGWRNHRYEVSTRDVPGNVNWFTVGKFLRAMADAPA